MLGRVTGVVDGMGKKTTYSYCSTNWVKEIKTPFNGSSYGLMSYQYDKAGNVIQESVKVSSAASRITDYKYDPLNRVTESKINGVTTTYQYDKAGNMINQSMANGTQTVSYAYDQLNRPTRYTDGLGMTESTDKSGNLEKSYEYNAFGNEVNPNSNDNNPFRYCGEYWDSETGSIYLRARYYSPGTGRFTTEDPIRDGSNWYSYCGGNPVNHTDPMGLWEPGDEKLSQEAQTYIKYYTKEWQEADKAYQNATTDEERTAAQQKMDFYHAAAGDIRCLDSKGMVTGTTHDVQVFRQGNFNLCWAYCQTMIEDYQAGGGMTQAQAAVRAREIAESVNGTGQNPDGSFVWNRGGWPTNSKDVTNQVPNFQTIGSFNDLSAFISNGPVYAYFSNGLPATDPNSAAHLIVVTGVASAPGHPNLVASNNPWGDANIQTYDDFMKGIPRDNSNPAMTFGGILRP